MVRAGLLAERRVGRTREIRANTDSLLYESLRRLLTLTYGPVPVLEDELSRLAGVESAIIYGSWAARHEGVEGSEPNDVDVLAIGQPDPDELYDAADRAGRRLGRPVSIRAVSPSTWHDGTSDPFLVKVRTSPMVALDLRGDR